MLWLHIANLTPNEKPRSSVLPLVFWGLLWTGIVFMLTALWAA